MQHYFTIKDLNGINDMQIATPSNFNFILFDSVWHPSGTKKIHSGYNL